MANQRKHIGVIKPTVPVPRVFFGSIQEIADFCKVSYRTAINLANKTNYTTQTGYRRMTTQEEELHYYPPKPPVLKKGKSKYLTKASWRIVFHKDWKRGYEVPKDPDHRFIGSPQDFVRKSGCNIGQIYRLLNTHQNLPEKYPLKSIKGWSIYRVYTNQNKTNKGR